MEEKELDEFLNELQTLENIDDFKLAYIVKTARNIQHKRLKDKAWEVFRWGLTISGYANSNREVIKGGNLIKIIGAFADDGDKEKFLEENVHQLHLVIAVLQEIVADLEKDEAEEDNE